MTGIDPATSAVRDVIAGWVAAVGRCDLDGVVAAHGDDVVMFDVPEPDAGVRGIDAYRSAWPPFFEWIRSGARFELDEIHFEADGSVAFAWALLRCGTDEDLAAEPHRRLRLSFGLRHDPSGWQIVHEHHSFAQA
ncbi:MAG: nuclear transport factor 2 family protein [Acidimicrobiales bacterium]